VETKKERKKGDLKSIEGRELSLLRDFKKGSSEMKKKSEENQGRKKSSRPSLRFSSRICVRVAQPSRVPPSFYSTSLVSDAITPGQRFLICESPSLAASRLLEWKSRLHMRLPNIKLPLVLLREKSSEH